MIKAVIFDYGKVISTSPGKNTRYDIAVAFNRDEDIVGKAIGMFIKDLRIGNISEDDFWKKMSEQLNTSVPNNKYELWRKGFREKLVIFEDMISYVRKLKEKNIKVAVISNNIMPWVDIIKERNGYAEFDLVLNSCEVGLSKPNPEIYKLALDKLNVKPSETIFIDDREENVETAKQLGMHVLIAGEDKKKLKSDIDKIIKLKLLHVKKIDSGDWGHSKYEAYLDLEGDYQKYTDEITGVAAVCINENDKIILVNNEPLGGRIEVGETPKDALRRECMEEGGFQIGITKYYGYYSITQSSGVNSKYKNNYPKRAKILFFIAKGEIISEPTDKNAGELSIISIKEINKKVKIKHKMLLEGIKLYPDYLKD